ncbi:MAG: sigma-70 family RNA polymerase sigma factor [Bacteroidota bacterium]|nr:sigma-70 family RNA polymerase sigma factor [Bacteroidota bacterium]MDP4231169.1 sigma-70 family RNA polymerase sigma factor [Bacteroidota bacterium]MDP4236001.1 sigma-70 family RNA polymerase sigma factor [Bacteroidota bacterium]
MQTVTALPQAQTDQGAKVAKFTARPARSAETARRPSASTSATKSVRSDLELLTAFRGGDERAFAEFYTRYKSEIYTFCLRMLGGDSAEAGDAFQETFIKVYEKIDTFRYGENVRGWLYMIARNIALNVYRSKRPEETIEFHQDLPSNERRLSPEFNGEQNSLRIALEDAIAKLPIEFREPFILREFDGLAYPEIAEITGTTMTITKVRIHRAKQRLRKMLAPIITDEAYRGEKFELKETEGEDV